MNGTTGQDEGLGSGHDRSERERDQLRELHELTGRPRTGDAPVWAECEPGPVGADGEPSAEPRSEPPAEAGQGRP